MEQVKALNALEPFVALTKSATSPRAAADLVIRATSATNTFLFAELLQTPQIQALSSSAEFAPYLTLLEIFSHGTYASYTTTPNLPPLNESQSLKLRQLSLLTLARDVTSLTYTNLMSALSLPTFRALEDLVISSIYANLIHGALDPRKQVVHIDSVAALRDVRPGSTPGLLSSLSAWAARCDATLADLERQMDEVRAAAAARAASQREWDEKKARLIEAEASRPSGADAERLLVSSSGGGGGQGGASADIAALLRNHGQRFGKRGSGHMDAAASGSGHDDEAMDLDEEDEPQDGKKRSSRRKL